MALVPGSPGSYNPGGGGGYGTNPWWGFMLIPLAAGMGMRVGRAGSAAVRSGTARKGLRTLSEIRRPIHETASFVFPHSRFLSSTLKVRKGLGAAALGYNLLNPFETIRYASKGDYARAVTNFFYPIVGVPIYNLVEGSSSQDLVQNGGPSAPLQVSSTHSDILSLGKISRPTRLSSAKRVIDPKRSSSARKGRRKRCPPGHRWNGRMCVPIRK